jgi:hypothetical protein
MPSCDAHAFILLFVGILLFSSSFTGTLWNLLAIMIVFAAIWVLMYNFQGQSNMQLKDLVAARQSFRNARGGVNLIVLISGILLLINTGMIIYAGVEKDKFMGSRESDDQYILMMTTMALSIVIMMLFLFLGYDSVRCFRSMIHDINKGSSVMMTPILSSATSSSSL